MGAAQYTDSVDSFKSIMRCPTQPAGTLGGRKDSNGVFDYSFPQGFSGLNINSLGTQMRWMVYSKNLTMPTPLIIEEHPNFINGDDKETGFGVWDQLDNYHFNRRRGGYMGIGGAMVLYSVIQGDQYRTGNGESRIDYADLSDVVWESPTSFYGGDRPGGNFNGERFTPN